MFLYCKFERREKKKLTIEAFFNIQNDVLDKLILCTKNDVKDTVENRDDKSYDELYKAYCVQIVGCEHFAVGINEKVFDFDTFNKLGGIHVMYLYEKLEPIIIETRNNSGKVKTYSEFEKLYRRLKEKTASIHKKGR